MYVVDKTRLVKHFDSDPSESKVAQPMYISDNFRPIFGYIAFVGRVDLGRHTQKKVTCAP